MRKQLFFVCGTQNNQRMFTGDSDNINKYLPKHNKLNVKILYKTLICKGLKKPGVQENFEP